MSTVQDLRVRTTCSACQKKCCTQPYDWVHLTIVEAATLSAASGLPFADFTHTHVNEATGGKFLLLLLPCRFYDATNGSCTVYEARPLVCQLFPFYPEPLTGRVELIVAQCADNLEFLAPSASGGWTIRQHSTTVSEWVRTIWRESTAR